MSEEHGEEGARLRALQRKQEARAKPHLMGFGINGRSETVRQMTDDEASAMIQRVSKTMLASAE